MSILFIFFLYILIFSVLEIQRSYGTTRSPNCLEPYKDQSSDGCLGFIPRFYYDVKNDECISFIYGGCGGTRNNFNSKEECEQSCDVQPKVVDIISEEQPDISPCLVPHDANQRCLGYIPRFYYDKKSNKCIFFIYGGCWGTPNNFVTKEDCEQSCVQPEDEDNRVQDEISPCSMTHEVKTKCLAYIPRFYYDQKSNECVSFFYGGCDATANNFESKEECEKFCLVQPK